MSVESQIRQALADHASSVRSAETDPYGRVSAAVAVHRRRRRITAVTAVSVGAVVAAVALGVPAVTSRLADRTVTPAAQSALPSSADQAWRSLDTWPARGGLASDTALVDDLDEAFDGHTIYAEDFSDGRVALVARSHEQYSIATGDRGARGQDMRLVQDGVVAAWVDGAPLVIVSTGVEAAILATPAHRTAEVSTRPTIALDGSVTRGWRGIDLADGVGREVATGLTHFRIGAYTGPAHFLLGGPSGSDTTPCEGPCDLDSSARQEAEVTQRLAWLLGQDPAAITSETAVRTVVPRDFRTPGLDGDDPAPELQVVHSRLPGGQVVRTSLLRDGDELSSLGVRAVDARLAHVTPLIRAGSGESDGWRTTVHVVVPSGTAVRAVSDTPSRWPSSAVVPLTGRTARFEVPVTQRDLEAHYRLEVLDAGRVLGSFAVVEPPSDAFDPHAS